jgi:hypothetical protein
VLDSLPQGDLMAELDDPPTLKEAESALKAMHNGKTAGFNGLPIEVYKVIWFSSEEGAKVLLEILCVFWESDRDGPGRMDQSKAMSTAKKRRSQRSQ